MLNVIEKIVVGVCGIFVLAAAALYGFIGLPSPKSALWIPPAREVPVATPTPKVKEPGATPAPVPPEIQSIAAKLSEQTGRQVSPSQLQRKGMQLPKETFEHLSNESNLLPALKTAKHRILQTAKGETRLQIYAIQKDSYLEKLGFQESDIIELVDGEILQFNDSSRSKYFELWGRAKDKLRAGGSISVTVTRGGRPLNLEFRL